MNKIFTKTTTAFATMALVLGASLGPVAVAQTSTSTIKQKTKTQATNKSVAKEKVKTTRSKKLPFSLDTLSAYYGPRVSDPLGSQTPDSSKNALTGISTEHLVYLGYHINKKYAITPTLDFDYHLTDANGNADRKFTWEDCYLSFSSSNILSADLRGNKLSMPGYFKVYAPTSDSSQKDNMITALRFELDPALTLGDSPFSISSRNYLKEHIYANNDGNLTSVSLYTGPELNYKISDKSTAFLLFEATMDFRQDNAPDTTDPNASLTDFEPGATINFIPRLELIPFLNWYTNQPVSTTSLNLYAIVHFL